MSLWSYNLPRRLAPEEAVEHQKCPPCLVLCSQRDLGMSGAYGVLTPSSRAAVRELTEWIF